MNDVKSETAAKPSAKGKPGKNPDPEGIVFVDAGWEVPQFYRPDPLLQRMLAELANRRILGSRIAATGRVMFPPQSICEVSFEETDELVEVGPGGVLRTFTIVHTKWGGREVPYIIAFVQFDGANTATAGFLRNVSTEAAGSLSLIGARCRAVFKDEPVGDWSDFWFELED